MTTQFKINNATQKAGNEKLHIVDKIKEKCGINYEQWVTVFFNLGCEFIEHHISRYPMQIALLANKELGFWDWWLILFIDDDESLLDFQSVQSVQSWQKEKQRLITLFEAHNQFSHFLNANIKLHAITV